MGFIHPVWWHPPDDGRLGMVVAEAVLNNINSLPRTWSWSSQSSAEGCEINIKHNKQFVEGTSNRAEPSSFSLNGGHLLPRWRLWRPSIGKGDESYKWEWGRHRLVNLFVKIVSKRSKWKLFMQFWQSVAIMFSPWKGPVWAESTRKICFRIFINKGWKRTLGSWSLLFFTLIFR